MKIDTPKDVQTILNILSDAEYEAYVVGGCVRDSLIGYEPHDWDITTDATPDDVTSLFTSKSYRVLPTGIEYGTVTVMCNAQPYEITTYRSDGKYSDNRHPDKVRYTAHLEEDLSRRDFTINAMAYNPNVGLIDLHGGQGDLKNRMIRCVGSTLTRLMEDPLRMLRAVRFSAQLSFNIDAVITVNFDHLSHLMERVSPERIQVELNKILLSGNPDYIEKCANLIKHIVPEFKRSFIVRQNNPYHVYNVGKHTVKSVASIDPKLHLRLAMFLHDLGKVKCHSTDEAGIDHFYGHPKVSGEIAERVLKALRYSNDIRDAVLPLVINHDIEVSPHPSWIRKYMSRIGSQTFEDLLDVREADISAQNMVFYAARAERVVEAYHVYKNIDDGDDCLTVKDLEINGRDLIEIGFKEGPLIGVVLKALLEYVLLDPEANQYDTLISRAKKIQLD